MKLSCIWQPPLRMCCYKTGDGPGGYTRGGVSVEEKSDEKEKELEEEIPRIMMSEVGPVNVKKK